MSSFDQLVEKHASVMDAYKKMYLTEAKKSDDDKVSDKDVKKVEDELEDAAAKVDEGIEHEDPEFGSWMDSVKAKHAGKDLKFKNRIEKGVHTTSAEVSGEDRSYGVWDHDSRKGHVFEEAIRVEEAKEEKNISVWSHSEKGWSHFSDYDSDDIVSAKDDRDYLKRQGEKKVKIIKTPKDLSDWRKPEHREAAIKMLSESCEEDDMEDADDSSIKNVEEGVDRSEASANRDLQLSAGNVGKTRSKGKFYLMKGTEQVHPDAHDNVDAALKAWKTLDSTSGVKIVKEDVDGPVDILTEETLSSIEGIFLSEAILSKDDHAKVLDFLKTNKMNAHSVNDIAEYVGTKDTNSVMNSLRSHAKTGLVSKYRGNWQYNHDETPVHTIKLGMSEESLDPNFVGSFNGVVTNYRTPGRQYDTVAFTNIKDANSFMSSEHGSKYGYLGQCANGMYHCADMAHEGYDHQD